MCLDLREYICVTIPAVMQRYKKQALSSAPEVQIQVNICMCLVSSPND